MPSIKIRFVESFASDFKFRRYTANDNLMPPQWVDKKQIPGLYTDPELTNPVPLESLSCSTDYYYYGAPTT